MNLTAARFVCLVALASTCVAAERDVRHEFAVQPGCTLKLDTYRGVITISESENAVVAVHVHLEVGGETEADAERVLAGLQLDVAAQNNTVTIFARNPRETRARWIWREDEQIGLFYRIAVPRHCHVDIRSTSGEVTVGRLEGRMDVRVDAGTVFFRGVDGDIAAEVGEGDLVIARCTGAVRGRVGKGSIRTGMIGGASELKNASGGIDVMYARGALTADATVGDVVVGFGREILGDARLRTSGGNIFVRVDPVAHCRVEAASRFGRVQNELPLAIKSGASGKRKLAGQLNSGGPLLSLRASGGQITLEPGPTPFE